MATHCGVCLLPSTATMRSNQLNRGDWLAEATRALVEGGVELVQITELARRLEITRGSFYWHFENRDALLGALLQTWRQRNTGVMLTALGKAQTLDDGLLALFAVWVDNALFDPDLDQAVRDWGRRSEDVLLAVQAEEAARVDAISTFFQSHGFDPTEAFIRARVTYFTQISFYALKTKDTAAQRVSYLDSYFKCFIGRSADPAAKAAFLEHIQETLE